MMVLGAALPVTSLTCPVDGSNENVSAEVASDENNIEKNVVPTLPDA